MEPGFLYSSGNTTEFSQWIRRQSLSTFLSTSKPSAIMRHWGQTPMAQHGIEWKEEWKVTDGVYWFRSRPTFESAG
jgi:hypothetical protein